MSLIIGGMLGSALTVALMSMMVYAKKGDEMNNTYDYDIRDCDNCIHHTDGGCTKWECEYEAADD